MGMHRTGGLDGTVGSGWAVGKGARSGGGTYRLASRLATRNYEQEL